MVWKMYLWEYPLFWGKTAIEKIIELNLTDEEKEHLYSSAKAVKETMEVLDKLEVKNRQLHANGFLTVHL